MPPQKKNPAAWGDGAEAFSEPKSASAFSNPNLILQLDSARRQLDADADVMNWLIDAHRRVRQAILVFQLVDCEIDITDLEEEVALLGRVIRALGWR
jgi:hypothetical protein